MKRLFCLLIALLLLASVCIAEEAGKDTAITLTICGIVIPAVLNDTAAAQDMISRMPMTVYVDRGYIDFCGSLDTPLNYDPEDFQTGFEYGDLIWMPEGNWFVIFTDGRESRMQREWLVLGHMDNTWEQLKDVDSSVSILIDRSPSSDGD